MYRAWGSAAVVSQIYFAIGLVSLLTALMVPALARRFPRRTIYLCASGLYLAGACIGALGGKFTTLALLCSVMAAAISFVCFNAYVLDHVAKPDFGKLETLRLFYGGVGWVWVGGWGGGGRVSGFYLLWGVGCGLFSWLLTVAGILPERGLLAGIDTPLVGASAGLYGFIVGVAFIQPKAMVQLLIPPVTLTMRNAALIFIGIAVAVIAGDILLGGSLFQNSGGEAGHLGGALAGFLLMKFPFLLGKGSRPGKILRPKQFRLKSEPKLRPRSEVDLAAAGEVDRILDKIARDGLQSLSEQERKTLHQAAEAYDKS